MKKIISFLKTRRIIKHNAYLFADYFKRGLYILSDSNFNFKRIRLINIFDVRKSKRLYFLKGKGDIELFSIRRGTEKINFISNNYVISKPFNMPVSMDEIKRRTDFYLPKLKLPHNSYKEINVEKNMIISNFVNGKVFDDDIHNYKLLTSFVRSSKMADLIEINNLYFYVQHGDATGANVIWLNDDSFATIDNEQVGLYPAFYDFFHLISIIVDTPEAFYDYCKANNSIFEKICEKTGSVLDISFIDEYVSLFVYFRMKSYPLSKLKANHRPFRFLCQNSSKTLFPISTRTLNNFYDDVVNQELEAIYMEAWSYHEK